MRTSITITFAILTLGACGKGSAPTPSAGSATPPITAAITPDETPPVVADAPAARPYCIERGKERALERLVATDDSATFCMTIRDGVECATVTFATGAFAAAPVPGPAPAVTAPVTTSADGTRKVTKVAKGFAILDAKTGAMIKSVTVGTSDFRCVGEPQFLGDTIYVTADLCERPRAIGWLFSRDGKRLGSSIESVNVLFEQPVKLDGDRWAIASNDSDNVLVFDGKTGKTQPAVAVLTPDQVAQCCDLTLGNAGEEGPTPASLARTPAGKLVTIGAAIAVIDLATDKVERSWMLPVCPK